MIFSHSGKLTTFLNSGIDSISDFNEAGSEL